jgi:hypothetical protein
MSWASVSPTVLPLAGVVIGACGTLLGQHLAMRVDARREADRRASDQRAERKEAIIGFLSATERVEQHRGQLAVEPDYDAGALIELMHAVWFAEKLIELVCSGALAQAAQDYTRELNRASQELRSYNSSRMSPALSAREQQLRAEFMETARRELGYAGEPLLRRSRAEDDRPDASTSKAFQS